MERTLSSMLRPLSGFGTQRAVSLHGSYLRTELAASSLPLACRLYASLHRACGIKHASCTWTSRTTRLRVDRTIDKSELSSIPLQCSLQYSKRWSSTEKKSEDEEAERRSDKDSESTTPLAAKIDATRQRSKVLTNKVRSSLTSLSPRENIYNLPNLLTASRLVAAPVIGYLVLHGHHKYAFALFAYAGVTDFVDGYLARRFKLQTVVGSVIDPMADKALMIILTTTLAMNGLLPGKCCNPIENQLSSATQKPAWPVVSVVALELIGVAVYLATLILGRDVSLAIAAIYFRYASLPTPKTVQRYWDFSLPSAEVHPTTMSKFNTLLQLLLIGTTLALPVVTQDNHHLGLMHDLGLENFHLDHFMTYFQWFVAGTTAWSGLSYAFLKNAVKILGNDEKLKAKQGARGRAIIGVTFGSIVVIAAWLATQEKQGQTSAAHDSQS